MLRYFDGADGAETSDSQGMLHRSCVVRHRYPGNPVSHLEVYHPVQISDYNGNICLTNACYRRIAVLHQILTNPVRANRNRVMFGSTNYESYTFFNCLRLYPIPARPRPINARVMGSGMDLSSYIYVVVISSLQYTSL